MLVSTLVLSAALSVGQRPLAGVALATARIALAPACVAAKTAVGTVRAAERIAMIPVRARRHDPLNGLVSTRVSIVAPVVCTAAPACSGDFRSVGR